MGCQVQLKNKTWGGREIGEENWLRHRDLTILQSGQRRREEIGSELRAEREKSESDVEDCMVWEFGAGMVRSRPWTWRRFLKDWMKEEGCFGGEREGPCHSFGA